MAFSTEGVKGVAWLLVILVAVAALAGGVIGALIGAQLAKPAEAETYKVETYKWKLIYALRSADLAMWNAKAIQNFMLLDALLTQQNQTPTRLAVLYSTKALEAVDQASTLLIGITPPEDVKTLHDNVVLKLQEMRQSILQLIQISNKTSYTAQDIIVAGGLVNNIIDNYFSIDNTINLALSRLKS